MYQSAHTVKSAQSNGPTKVRDKYVRKCARVTFDDAMDSKKPELRSILIVQFPTEHSSAA